MTSKSIHAAFKRAKMPLRCTKNQLHDYVTRARKNLSDLPARTKDGLRATELQAAAEPFQLDFEAWQQQSLHRLMVLPGAVFEEERVCVSQGVAATLTSKHRSGSYIRTTPRAWKHPGTVFPNARPCDDYTPTCGARPTPR